METEAASMSGYTVECPPKMGMDLGADGSQKMMTA